jgi:translocator assembly and maintenance protein 41
MTIGEDKGKISKLVSGGMDQLMEVYVPLLLEDRRLVISGQKIEQDNSTAAIYHRLNLLPSRVVEGLSAIYYRRDHKVRDMEEVLFSVAHRHDVAEQLATSIRAIVGPSSIRQTVKNAFSAGFMKSIVYSSSKLVKMFKSMR